MPYRQLLRKCITYFKMKVLCSQGKTLQNRLISKVSIVKEIKRLLLRFVLFLMIIYAENVWNI